MFAVTTGFPARRAASEQTPGRLDATDELDDEIDRGIVHDRESVGGKAVVGGGDGGGGTLFTWVLDRDARDPELEAGAERYRLGL